jgi:hypothetical protein
VGSVQPGSGATRPNTIPLPFLTQSPSFFVPISYSDNPQSLGFSISDGNSRTYFPQGIGVSQVTETYSVNLQVSGGPFAPCTSPLQGGTGCTNCGDTKPGGITLD